MLNFTSFLPDVIDILISMTLQQVAQDGPVAGFAVVEGLDRDRVAQDTRGGQQVARTEYARRLIRTMYLDPARTDEPYNPYLPGAVAQELADLGSQICFVPPGTGILDGQGGHVFDPALLAAGRCDSHIRGTQGSGVGRKAGIDSRPFHVRIGFQNRSPGEVASGMLASRRRAVDRVPIA